MLTKVKRIITAAENRESFFRRVAVFFPTLDPRYQTIERAYNDAKDAFRGSLREDGSRYFEHIRAVVLIMMDYLRVKRHDLIVTGLLHDIVEDIPSWPLKRIQKEYGDEIALYIEYISKPPLLNANLKERRDFVYHMRFEAAPRDFFLVKLSDRLHNLLTLWDCTPEKRARKIAETRQYYLPYAEKHFILYHEILAAIEELETAQETPPLQSINYNK